jgi:transcriptional regulator with XRE-family HTH domain
VVEMENLNLEINYSEFGKGLKLIRSALGKTQKKFVEDLKLNGLTISYQTYINYEATKDELQIHKMILLIHVIKKTYEEDLKLLGMNLVITSK